VTDLTIIEDKNNFIESTPEQYDFAGFPLTPGGVEKVIFLCCSGNLSRSEIIERVYDYHLKNGGIDSRSDKTSTVKKALSSLLLKGEIPKQVVKGHYIIGDKSDVEYSSHVLPDDSDDIPFDQEETSGAVYAYYYPSYERLAGLEGKNSWPIKIGQTDRYVTTRLMTQATAFPEAPVVLYAINSKNPKLLESTIHGIYKLRGRSCYEKTKDESVSSGTEWFETNPVELLTILDFLGVTEEDYFSID